MRIPGGVRPIYLAAAMVIGLGIGALVTETMGRREALLVAGLFGLVAVGGVYELWHRLRR